MLISTLFHYNADTLGTFSKSSVASDKQADLKGLKMGGSGVRAVISLKPNIKPEIDDRT